MISILVQILLCDTFCLESSMKKVFVFLFFAFSVVKANAAVITLTPGDSLEFRFELSAPPPPTVDTLAFNIFNTSFDLGLLTVELFDGGVLLGTDVNTVQGSNQLSHFVSSTSLFDFSNPAIVNFASILDGSIDGIFKVSVTNGFREIDTDQVSLNLATAFDGSGTTIYEFLSFTRVDFIQGSPTSVPEPPTLLLLILCVAFFNLRRVK